jgi:zinc transporter 1/2/3
MMGGAGAILWAKFFSAVAIFFVGWLAGMLPLASQSFRENKALMSLANTFSAGVFLAIGLCHLLPEAAERLAGVHGGRFPIAHLLCVAGYTLLLAVDRVLAPHSHPHGHGHSHGGVEPFIASADPVIPSSEGRTPLGSAFTVGIALALHGAAEGVALGLQTRLVEVIPMAGAILAHKWAEALALGIALSAAGPAAPGAYGLMALFSLCTPVSIVFGSLLSTALSPVAVAYVLAAAAGSFLYLGATEVVGEEFRAGQPNGLRLLAFALGIASMVLVAAAEAHPHHSHGGPGDLAGGAWNPSAAHPGVHSHPHQKAAPHVAQPHIRRAPELRAPTLNLPVPLARHLDTHPP